MENKYCQIIEHLRDDGFNFQDALHTVQQDLEIAQNSDKEHQANTLWAIRTVIEIHYEFSVVFELLQQGEYYKAWCNAEQVEIKSKALHRNFIDVFKLVKDLYESIVRLQGLYPYTIFSSYVINIKRERCSICNQIRSIRHDCGHRKGYLYNGHLCCNIVEDLEIKSIDIVDNPVNKFAVLFATSKDGEREDNYDYTLIKCLMRYWQKPFQHWTYDIRHTHKPFSDFPGLSDKDFCPCGSGLVYAYCCKSDPQGIKHKIFQFRVEDISCLHIKP